MSEKETFELREEHVRLLRRGNVWWFGAEYGAPCLDPKRPYGNSDVEGDICEILGWRDTEEHRQMAAGWHTETQTALQVILAAGTFEPGEYECDKYRRNWRRCDD